MFSLADNVLVFVLSDVVLEMPLIEEQRCVLIGDKYLMKNNALLGIFGLALNEVIMAIDDVCFGSCVFSIHCYIRNYNFYYLNFRYLVFLFSLGKNRRNYFVCICL